MQQKALSGTYFRMVTILCGVLSLVMLVSSCAISRPVRQGTPPKVAVLTYHNDTFRTGQNRQEAILNTKNVTPATFGKLVSYPVDGEIYAQPLVVPDVRLPDGSVHDIVYVATESDSVYAFDANAVHAGAPLWHASFVNADYHVIPVPSPELYPPVTGYDIFPYVGITGTPVIDRASGTLYVVTMTEESGRYVERLHALDIATGKEKPSGPVDIKARVTLSGPSGQRTVTFNVQDANQRPALLLSHGVIYIAWASFGDYGSYHGWVMGYDATTLKQVFAYADTPDGNGGGIWMGGDGPAADESGNVYVISGNGPFNLDQNGSDASNTILRFSPGKGSKVTDYFTPFNQFCLNDGDVDLGSGGPLLLPDQSGAHQHELVAMGKEGRLYLVDRDHMGQYQSISDPCSQSERMDVDAVVQEFQPQASTNGGTFFGTPTYWQGTKTSGPLIYIGAFHYPLKAYRLVNGELATSPSSSAHTKLEFPGATASVSSNGSMDGTGIVWVVTASSCDRTGCNPQGEGILRAYDATNLSKELYNSEMRPARDRLESYVKFSVPTVANGKVFVGTGYSLAIYGLLAGS